MRNAVLLDTSFLITLADPRRPRHAIAKQYFQHFLGQRMPMMVSAIVVSEFCVRQELATLPLEQLILLPFTHEDAVAAAGFDFKSFQEGGAKDRQSLKDDLKIIGHAHVRDFGYVISDGSRPTEHRYTRKRFRICWRGEPLICAHLSRRTGRRFLRVFATLCGQLIGRLKYSTR